jgi:Fe-S-cluster-containing dehydrogenase component
MKRRDFIKATLAGTALTVSGGASTAAHALQREARTISPDAMGMLYDSTLCVGCKACMSACKEANHLPPEPLPEHIGQDILYDEPLDLSAKTFNIIKAYTDGNATVKDREQDGFAFVKRQCLHCVDPSCVSACPVSAMQKDPVTGVVTNDPGRCIGCRYCVLACPFQVPKYEYDKALGKIRKCELCKDRLAEGKMTACADVCPTGATLFGKVFDLKAEARRRLDAKPGSKMVFPRGWLGKNDRAPHEAVLAAYKPELYGDKQLGGTQVTYLAAVDFGKLGFPTNVPDVGYPTYSEGVQHTLYKGMILPLAVLGGLIVLAKRNVGGSNNE